MKKARLYIGIFIYCIILSIILIFGSIKNSTNFSGKSIQSALINLKYKTSINMIKLEFPDNELIDSIVFTKKDFWKASAGGISFNADSALLSNMLESFCATQDFILLTDNFSAWEQFAITEQDAIHVSFYESSGGNDTLRSELYFGKNTADYSGVYVRNGKNASVYRIKSDFSSFLSPYIDFWADLSVFQTQSQNLDNLKETDIISVSVTKSDLDGNTQTAKLYEDGSSEYKSYIHTLFSLNGSGLVSLVDAESLGITKILEINAANQSSKNFSVVVYTTHNDTELGARYFIQFKTDNDASYPNYMIEISAWTYKNLLPQSFM